ncbi:MAG: RNA polymerase subunit sigma-70 [Saccharofermentanales bacterium]|jgi:predicted nucleic acid-binding Zn ribbon protein
MGQQQKIRQGRDRGLSYREISTRYNISLNTVKSFCQRNGLGADYVPTIKLINRVCPNCGESIKQMPGCKVKRFCSDSCRQAWWQKERRLKRAGHEKVCLYCGKKFKGRKERKFCSHSCYIKFRFAGDGCE